MRQLKGKGAARDALSTVWRRLWKKKPRRKKTPAEFPLALRVG
jgi:hypothetical protein